jgi:hypothetical protein
MNRRVASHLDAVFRGKTEQDGHSCWALVLREVRMSRREVRTFKIVAGAVVLGAFAIAVAIGVALV